MKVTVNSTLSNEAAEAIESMKKCGYSQGMKAKRTRKYILCLNSELGVCGLTKQG